MNWLIVHWHKMASQEDAWLSLAPPLQPEASKLPWEMGVIAVGILVIPLLWGLGKIAWRWHRSRTVRPFVPPSALPAYLQLEQAIESYRADGDGPKLCLVAADILHRASGQRHDWLQLMLVGEGTSMAQTAERLFSTGPYRSSLTSQECELTIAFARRWLNKSPEKSSEEKQEQND